MPPTPTNSATMILRLRESMAFFRVYGRELLRFFCLLYLPVVLAAFVIAESGIETTETGFPAVTFIFNFFYQPIYTGALIYQLKCIETGKHCTLRDGFVVGVRLWDKLLLVNLISLVLTFLGFMAFIFPSLIVYARLALAEFRVVIDGDHPKDALKNSFEMTRPYMLPIIGCSAILLGVYLGLQLAIDWLTATLAMPMLFAVIMNAALSVVLIVFLTILLFRFYGLAESGLSIND